MAQVYFHYSNEEEILVARCGTAVGNLAEAHEHATLAVRALIAGPGAEDWRSWILHVNDDLGEELFAVPFTSVLGRPH